MGNPLKHIVFAPGKFYEKSGYHGWLPGDSTKIETSAKGRAVPLQYHTAKGTIFPYGSGRLYQGTKHLLIKAIMFIWPIQGHIGNMFFFFKKDSGVLCHALKPCMKMILFPA
jgi:hypothetical protein